MWNVSKHFHFLYYKNQKTGFVISLTITATTTTTKTTTAKLILELDFNIKVGLS